MPPDYGRREERPAPEPPENPVKLRVSDEVLAAHADTKGVLMHITDMISLYPGSRDVLVYLPDGRTVRVNEDRRVTYSDELRDKLIKLLGAENVKA